MTRLLLTLLTVPSILAPLMLTTITTAKAEGQSTLEATPYQLDLSVVKTRNLPPMGSDVQATESESFTTEHPMLDFTLEESNTAIALFGCDCPAHLNALRKLRGLPPVNDISSSTLGN